MMHLGVDLALQIKFEDNGVRSINLNDIRTTRQRHHPPISNRDTLRLETAVTQSKQRAGRISNRDKNAVFQNTIWTANKLDRRLPGPSGHRILIGNQIIRLGGNPKKTKDATHL
jgi:hypothetical protein